MMRGWIVLSNLNLLQFSPGQVLATVGNTPTVTFRILLIQLRLRLVISSTFSLLLPQKLDSALLVSSGLMFLSLLSICNYDKPRTATLSVVFRFITFWSSVIFSVGASLWDGWSSLLITSVEFDVWKFLYIGVGVWICLVIIVRFILGMTYSSCM